MICATNLLEQQLQTKGFKRIIGIDEVGYGAIAGPVVVCSVILKQTFPRSFMLCDSKILSKVKREIIYTQIQEFLEVFSIGQSTASEINRYGIREATNQAIVRSIQQLPIQADYALIDGTQAPKLDLPFEMIIRGDQSVRSIAAASILAKVTRDRWMEKMSNQFPLYGFATHKGYGTKKHLEMVRIHGVCKHHRIHWKCFDPNVLSC
ncbi:ribonuclease HII [Candidatus Uhrbacteria bacterium CG_4_9_14_3_um_filter_36_7]|uniref:Ribonuclease HII n=1 Tax=Candidatus Uhrbacteria bacterium CG_4_9_14_3_um_filter_36_7 TaxID=1975033 RepID=A0A2M7XFT1_9BACT|nr:MAG: ribonuclease HII [Candidatus Uhrbacteria bacterium CG_4_9_14_3_um_filter_36_7]